MNPLLNRLLKTATLLVAFATMSGCASSGQLYSDYDRGADFGKYHTYNFMEGAGPESTEYQSLFSKYMIEAIEIEMEKRGYKKADDPDLWVNFNAIVQEKTKVSTRPASPPTMTVGMGYYGYRGGYYGTWGAYNYGTETHVSQYNEGTFNIDLVDNEKDQLVWEAVGIGRVTAEGMANLRVRVAEGVPKFFELYPFVAGQSEPVVNP